MSMEVFCVRCDGKFDADLDAEIMINGTCVDCYLGLK